MPAPGQLGLVDLVVIVVVLGTLIRALRRRSGVLSALAGAVGAALFCWIAGAAVLVWAPPALADPVTSSYLFSLVPPPVHAVDQAGRLVRELVTTLTTSTTTEGPLR